MWGPPNAVKALPVTASVGSLQSSMYKISIQFFIQLLTKFSIKFFTYIFKICS